MSQFYGVEEEKDNSILMIFRREVSSDTISIIHQQIPTMSEKDKKNLEKLLMSLISECSHHKPKVVTTYENILKLLTQSK